MSLFKKKRWNKKTDVFYWSKFLHISVIPGKVFVYKCNSVFSSIKVFDLGVTYQVLQMNVIQCLYQLTFLHMSVI